MGLSGRIPRRVDTATKHALLGLVGEAVAAGWTVRRCAATLELTERRLWRWQHRRADGRLDDRPSGGGAVHGVLDDEIAQIVALFHEWGEIDRSHRKLAHRGSYLARVWVSPSTVRRVLATQGLVLDQPPSPGRTRRTPFPDWVDRTPNSIWIYDTTHFPRSKMAVTVVEDLVSRKWLGHHVSSEETSTQIEIVFTAALEAEGLDEELNRRLDGLVPIDEDDERRPILLAVSDNGPQMTSGSTREFMTLASIAQHFGRPGTPTDQAWIESLFGHLKRERPHLNAITDPAILRAELHTAQAEYNATRLHQGIGYVTPNDEHAGRGPTIRKARRVGLDRARQRRVDTRQTARQDDQEPGPDHVG